MENKLLIGDGSWGIPSYESGALLNPRITQGQKSLSGSSDKLPSEKLPPQKKNWNIILVSESEVKEAFLQYASDKCCYSTTPAKKMIVRNLTPLNTYRYRLETFTETRETHLASEIYKGGFVDSCAVAPPPAPWEIRVDPPPLFSDCKMHIPIPHTYSVQNCQNCGGRGRIKCKSCDGAGKKKCSSCGGSGNSFQENMIVCSFCSGSGSKRCSKCSGEGLVKCHSCNGSGILLFHTELTITWKNNVTEQVAEKNTDFPAYHFQEVTGREIFCNEQPMASPIVGFPEPSIDAYSRACIAQHKMQFAYKDAHCVLRQKQTIEVVPLTKVEYDWNGRLHSFYLFGNENRVYTKDYPARCCCSVM